MRTRSRSKLHRWVGSLLLVPSLLSVGCALSGPPPGGMPGPPPGGPGGMRSQPLTGGMPGMMQPGMQGGMPGMMQPGMQGGMPGMMPPGMQGGMPGMMPPGMQGGMPGMMQPGMQGGMPGMMPPGMQGGRPGMMPASMQGGMPGMMPAGMQGGMPGMMPPGMQGGMPGMMPPGMQGGMPGMMPPGMQGGMPGMMPAGMRRPAPSQQSFTDPRAGYQAASQPPQASSYQAASIGSPNQSAVAQVGFHQPILGSRVGDCGCNECGPAQPHGYAMLPPGVWNGHDPQEYLCDGGDKHPAARLNRQDLVDGLQPEDTVVHYVTDDGDIEFQASNRTCLYAPRFASVRRITSALAGGRSIGLAQVDMPVSAGRFEHEIPGLVITESTELGHADVARRIDAMREQIRGVPVEGILQLEQTGDVLEALAALSLAELRMLQDEEKAILREHALAALTWELNECLEVVIEDLKPPTLTRDQHLQGLTIYEFPDAGRLQITKLADRSDALPGDIVRFVLRVENVGDSTVDEVTLIDNLTTRLEYVDGSQTSTREANFEFQPNDGQSLRLSWKLQEPLKVGEEATIRFECKVR